MKLLRIANKIATVDPDKAKAVELHRNIESLFTKVEKSLEKLPNSLKTHESPIREFLKLRGEYKTAPTDENDSWFWKVVDLFEPVHNLILDEEVNLPPELKEDLDDLESNLQDFVSIRNRILKSAK